MIKSKFHPTLIYLDLNKFAIIFQQFYNKLIWKYVIQYSSYLDIILDVILSEARIQTHDPLNISYLP